MGSSRRGPPGFQFALPPLAPWLRNVLIAVFAMFIVELILVNFVGVPLYQWFAWSPSLTLSTEAVPTLGQNNQSNVALGLLSAPFHGPEWGDLWQPATQFFVQGPQPFAVLLNLLMIYFFLPYVVDRFTRKQLVQIAVVVVLGCAAAGWLWAGITALAVGGGLPVALNWLATPGLGMGPIVFVLIALFALANPDRTINLMFVLPLKARWLLWIDLGLITLMFLARPGVGTFQEFGAFGAIVAWWFLLGPGATRRKFKQAGRNIEKDLRFKVYDGGRQGGSNAPDEWVN